MIFSFGELEIDHDRYELRHRGVKVPVQPKALDVLFLLVKNRDRVVTRRELHREVWAGVTVTEGALARVMMEARRAIGDELQQVVVTIRGRGFRFAGDVVELAQGSATPAPAPVQVPERDPTF